MIKHTYVKLNKKNILMPCFQYILTVHEHTCIIGVKSSLWFSIFSMEFRAFISFKSYREMKNVPRVVIHFPLPWYIKCPDKSSQFIPFTVNSLIRPHRLRHIGVLYSLLEIHIWPVTSISLLTVVIIIMQQQQQDWWHQQQLDFISSIYTVLYVCTLELVFNLYVLYELI